MRLLALLLVACSHAPAAAPKPPAVAPAPALVAKGDWTVSPTDAFRGKQDDIVFVSPEVGFYGNGAGKVFRTDDGGASWTKLLEKPGTFVRAVGFLDDKRGFIGNIGPDAFPGVTDAQMLYRTRDGGTTWEPVALPDTDGARGVCAIDIVSYESINMGHRLRRELVHVGGRVGGPAALFRSEDGGESWKRVALPAEVAMILDVKFFDASVGFVFAGSDPDVAASNGLIARTLDGGRTWKVVYRSTRPFELMWKGAFPSRKVGYATLQNYSTQAGAPGASTQRYVVKTEDGGETWRELPMVDDGAVNELGIGFVDERHGWVGAMPHGFETMDGGATWKQVDSLPVAANKFRVVRHPDGAADVWTIGLDVRKLQLQVGN